MVFVQISICEYSQVLTLELRTTLYCHGGVRECPLNDVVMLRNARDVTFFATSRAQQVHGDRPTLAIYPGHDIAFSRCIFHGSFSCAVYEQIWLVAVYASTRPCVCLSNTHW